MLHVHVGIGKVSRHAVKNDWKPWHMGTHLRAFSKSYPINTNMTGLIVFQISLPPCVLDEGSLSRRRSNSLTLTDIMRLELPVFYTVQDMSFPTPLSGGGRTDYDSEFLIYSVGVPFIIH